ncbi:MAG: glycosyltransferase [Acidimicrobiales bacterium]
MVGWLALLPLLAWTWLLVGRGRFWRTDIRLRAAPPPPQWPAVAVVVPARDEADLLEVTLASLLDQDYPGPAHVVVVDDRSTDDTASAARALAGAGRLDLTVVAGRDPPDGWTGKLWALHQGIARATGAGDPWLPPPAGAPPAPAYVLLTDADIAHPPDGLRRLVAWAEASHLDQVSLMARLSTASAWERLLVPAFVYFFAELYPFGQVNRQSSRTAAAAGGCILVRTAALERAGGVAAVRGAVIDDVALARALKRSGAALWLGLADDTTSVRPYPRLGDIWDMVARSAYTQLRHSPALLAGTVVGLAAVFVGPPAALVGGVVAGLPQVAALGASAWLVMALTYLPMLAYHRLAHPRLAWWRALGLPAVAVLYVAMTLSSAWRHWRGGVAWKGRTYDRSGAWQAHHPPVQPVTSDGPPPRPGRRRQRRRQRPAPPAR